MGPAVSYRRGLLCSDVLFSRITAPRVHSRRLPGSLASDNLGPKLTKSSNPGREVILRVSFQRHSGLQADHDMVHQRGQGSRAWPAHPSRLPVMPRAGFPCPENVSGVSLVVLSNGFQQGNPVGDIRTATLDR